MSYETSQTPQLGESSWLPDSSDHGRIFKARVRTSRNLSIRNSGILSREQLSFPNGPVGRLFTNSQDESSLGLNKSPQTRTMSVSDSWGHRGDEMKPQVVHEPPRPPREGYEWVWFPEGYWAERQTTNLGRGGDKSKLRLQWKRKSPKGGKEATSPRSNREAAEFESTQDSPKFPLPQSTAIAPSSKKDGQRGTEEPLNSSKILRRIQYMSLTRPHFVSPTSKPEGLYYKAKRGIERWRKRKESKGDHLEISGKDTSRTTTVLEGVSSYFNRMQHEPLARNRAHISAEGQSFSRGSVEHHRQIGLAPWHRMSSQDSIWSASSSIRGMLRGRTPLATPQSEQHYNGRDGKKYARVEISNVWDPNFLPSEAQRISTPPLLTGAITGSARGFFFNLGSPSDESVLDPALGDRSTRPNKSSGKTTRVPSSTGVKHEWWDGDDYVPTPVSRRQSPTTQFELDAPEHLPLSPLCPVNPKHQSGGAGICVYHGRQRTSGSSSIAEQVVV